MTMAKRGSYRRRDERIERRERLGYSTIHILRHGLPACLFTTEAPEYWPDGHRWLGVHQQRHKVTCESCLKTAKEGMF